MILPSGWSIFFMKTVLVPPNRFRPSAKIGDNSAEHPQTTNLSKIIEANEKIRNIQAESMSKVKPTLINTSDESLATLEQVCPSILYF